MLNMHGLLMTFMLIISNGLFSDPFPFFDHLYQRHDSRRWMDQRIQEDLAPFSTIQSEDLDKIEKILRNGTTPFLRIKIVNGKFHYTTKEMDLNKIRFVSYFKKVQIKYRFPDLDGIIILCDQFDEMRIQEINAPVFCISKLKSDKKNILIPELYYYSESEDRHGVKIPWNEKMNVAFWRGKNTGQYLGSRRYTLDNWICFPRTQLVLLSKQLPEQLNCLFSSPVQKFLMDPGVEELMREEGFFDRSVSHSEQNQYKYLIAIDGYTWPSSLRWQLFSNSVVLKSESDWLQWFDGALIPYKHYVPFHLDLSDLSEKLDWLAKNDDLAKEIAQNALSLALKTLTEEDLNLYVHKLFVAYAKRMQ
ncbi:MAG: glycosyl transferase family 90 [Parachlamydiaceae bacterium]